MPSSSAGPSIAVESLTFVGTGLARPECVLATARGDLYVSDRSGGVCRIRPDGAQDLIGGGADILPNGIALLRDGSFLVANLNQRGGVWKIAPDGQTTPFLLEVAGAPLPTVNFVRIDEQGRVWICANAPLTPDGHYRTEKAEGYIVMVDGNGPRVVAEAIGWANECLVDPSGRHLFVNETFARCVTRFDIAADGSLSNRIVYAQFGHGTFPDGIALDAEGGIWVVGVAANRLVRVTPEGRQHIVLEDNDAADLDTIDQAYSRHQLTRSSFVKSQGRTLHTISSIAFGGADLRNVYLGCLAGDRLAMFRSPIAGHPPIHWHW